VITDAEIREVADATGVAPLIIEKDYAIGWVLAGIFAHANLHDTWVFKGGTCLKKCFFETYRFSEDLDFTLRDATQLDADFLIQAFREVAAWIQDTSGLDILSDRLRFDVHQEGDRVSCEGRVYYRSHYQPLDSSPRIKLDLTAMERLVLPPVKQEIFHPYTDRPADGIEVLCYAYEEVFGEKSRALGERADRGAVRDLYDIIHFFRNRELRPAPAVVLDVLQKKCAFKDIAVPTLADLLQYEDAFRTQWELMLQHQLPSLPPFETFWAELPGFFDWLTGNAREEELIPFPGAEGGEVLRPAFGGLRYYGVRISALEVVRFAAANRLCVNLDYTTEDGRRSTRFIEPYSLRQTEAGDILLYAVRVQDRGVRGYRVDRIEGAELTDQVFTPQYQIELSPHMPVRASKKLGTSNALGLPDYDLVQSVRPTRAKRPARSLRKPRMRSSTGPTYKFRCTACGKLFKRKKMNGVLKPHKRRDGSQCFGSYGSYEGTIF